MSARAIARSNSSLLRTNPYNPFGVTCPQCRLFRHPSPCDRSRSAPLRADREDDYGSATLDGSFGRQMVLGRQRPLGPEQGQPDDVRQHQRAALSEASGRSPPAPRRRLRAARLVRNAGRDHAGDARFHRLRPARQSQQKIWGSSANVSASCSMSGRTLLGVAAGVEYRRLTGRFDPDPDRPGGFSTDIPRRRRAAATRSPRSMPSSTRPSSRDVRAPNCSSSTVRAATRTTDYSAGCSHSVFKTASTGSRSTRSACAHPMRRASALRHR